MPPETPRDVSTAWAARLARVRRSQERADTRGMTRPPRDAEERVFLETRGQLGRRAATAARQRRRVLPRAAGARRLQTAPRNVPAVLPRRSGVRGASAVAVLATPAVPTMPVLPVVAVHATTPAPVNASHRSAARADTGGTTAVAPDTASADGAERAPVVSAGFAAGGVAFYGGRTEQAATVTLRIAPRPWLAVAVAPTTLTVREPRASGGAQRLSGLADLPLTVQVGHALPLYGAPALGASYTLVVPVGDTATGMGGGQLGRSLDVDLGWSPLPRLYTSVGAGRALAGFSPRAVFDATAAAWGNAGASVEVGRGVELSAGYGRGLGPVDSAEGRTQTVSGGLTFRAPGVHAVTVGAARGLSGAAPRWSLSVGVGRAVTSFGAMLHAHSPGEAAADALGAGPHGLPASSAPGAGGSGRGASGNTPGTAAGGSTGASSEHGRGHHG